ncbi:MAG: hypothetical protein K6E34_08425, partial [Lachnospiraceae bacterium]|nr:hypothetical protein [Lachnospiraceae bacterium]
MDRSDMSAGLKEFPVKELIDSGNCAVYGRTTYGLDILPLFWNHSGIELVCDGSELWVELEADCGFYEPWIAAELNGALMSRRMLLASDRYLCLYRSMEPNVK